MATETPCRTSPRAPRGSALSAASPQSAKGVIARWPRLWTTVLTLAGSGSGCAIDGTGLALGRVTPARGAEVIEVYAIGGVLRSHAACRGLTLGGTKATYVFPGRGGGRTAPSWHWFQVPLPDGDPVSVDVTALGADLGLADGAADLTLGLRRRTVLARVPADGRVAWTLAYFAGAPERTKFRYLAGEDGR